MSDANLLKTLNHRIQPQRTTPPPSPQVSTRHERDHILNLADAVSRFIAAEPEKSFAKRIIVVFTPRTTLTTSGDLPAPAAIANAVTAGAEFAKISPGTSTSAATLIHAGVMITMPILERIMQPLIRASEARGEARGRDEATAELEEQFMQWKQDQVRRGVIFVEDEPPNAVGSTDEDSTAERR